MTVDDELANRKGWDETLSLELPDTDPVIDQPAPETPPVEAPVSGELTIDKLKAINDVKVRLPAIDARKHSLGSLYAHLKFTEVDWTFEGRYVCRAVGLECSGLELRSVLGLAVHLHNPVHMNHEKSLATEWVWVAPVSETAAEEDGDEGVLL
ncbi:hypothetical protein ACHAP8_008225 [Fusarium lateritium]